MEDFKFIFEIITAALSAIIGFTVWLIRIEGKNRATADQITMLDHAIQATQKDVDSIRTKQEIVDTELSKELKSIQVELAQIKGYLMHTGKTKYTPKG